MNGPRILLYDLETSLQLAAVFQLKNNDWISPDNLVTERYVISACWKWLGEKKIHSVSVLDDPLGYIIDPFNDKHVVKVFHDVLETADVVITHNGDRFDNKYMRTRILFHGLTPLPPITSIDTCKIAKSQFLFNANRLDYLGKFLGLGGKKHTSSGLWLDVLSGSESAIREMVTYNKRDVTLLEEVFLKLRPYIPSHVNRELFGKSGCPRCGSNKVQSRGTHKAITKVYQRFMCTSCGGWFRLLKGEKGSTTYRVL